MAVVVSFIYLCHKVIKLLERLKKVNSTSPSLPENPPESEQLFRKIAIVIHF